MKTMAWMVAVGLLALGAMSAQAQDIAKAQEQMKKRLPEVAQLKTQKAVGEDNAGYLALLKTGVSKETRELVEAENADRKTIYEAVAAKTGTTAQKVGELRAKEIVQRATKGVMLQREDGTWFEKQ